MSAFLRARRVVDAVAGHGHDVLLALQEIHQADLVFWRHAGHHADLGQLFHEFVIAHSLELCAGEGGAFDAQLVADGRRGHGVVAGDHAHLDAGAVALGDGVFGLGARRIDDADHGHQRQVGDQLDQVGLGVEGCRVEVAAGHHHHTFARGCHTIVLGDRQIAGLVGHGRVRSFRHPEVAAAVDQHVGRALDEGSHHRLALLVGHVVEGSHELVARSRRAVRPRAGTSPWRRPR